MSPMVEQDEELGMDLEAPDRELTLSSMTLLGIFFGLVLICGLCFGLGFTLGKRSVDGPSTALPAASSASAAVQTAYRTKPSASAQRSPEAEPVVADQASAVEPPSGEAGVAEGPSETNAPKPEDQPAIDESAAGTNISEPTAAPVAGTFMVQIAAVSNPSDAEVLIGALGKRGYTVAVRHESGNTLLHVQVGPFATRAEAIAMRQKLLGDGYNAILK